MKRTWLPLALASGLLLLTACRTAPAAPVTSTPQPPPPAQAPVAATPEPPPPSPAPTPEPPKLAPGTTLWAVDPKGALPPEELWKSDLPIHPAATSPDGRYVLLIDWQGLYKGDYRAAPYLLDRQTGKLTGGTQLNPVRGPFQWSGHGFVIDRLTHLGLDLQVDTFPRLREALKLNGEERALIAGSFSADGKRWAGLVGPQWQQDARLDLIVAATDGANLSVSPGAVKATLMQIGHVAHLRLAPTGERFIIMAENPKGALIALDAPQRDRWLTLPTPSYLALDTSWAPDGQKLWVPGTGVVDVTGKVLLPVPNGSSVLWHPDSRHFALPTPEGWDLWDLQGSRTRISLPEASHVAGFLPDGRILASRTVRPTQ